MFKKISQAIRTFNSLSRVINMRKEDKKDGPTQDELYHEKEV
jgi:hypothetical protein